MKDIEIVLDKIRENCIILSDAHKQNYVTLKSTIKYYRVPAIIFSAMNVFASVGLQPYMQQGYISLITCGISLTTGIIVSIELFNDVQNIMEMELSSSKDFYILSIDIFRLLSLSRENRGVEMKKFLDEKYQLYCELFEKSTLLDKNMLDKLVPIDMLICVVVDDIPSPITYNHEV
jgi:general stress protein CsbA